MGKIIIEMSMSLDGFVAGPDDGEEFPNGRDGIKHVFGWYSKTKEEGGADAAEVDRMYAQSGAYIFGRRTYDITNGWSDSHPVKGVPLFILTHIPPARDRTLGTITDRYGAPTTNVVAMQLEYPRAD